MAARRKDPKGRVLKEGESYRKSDNLYMYRYRDMRRKTKAVYIRTATFLLKMGNHIIRRTVNCLTNSRVGTLRMKERAVMRLYGYLLTAGQNTTVTKDAVGWRILNK